MIRTSAVAAVAIFFGLTSVLVACSSSDEPTDPCEKNPKARGCSKMAAAPPQTSASPYNTSVATPPPPVVADAGADGPHKPDAGPVVVPPPNYACQDLMRCCGQVIDSLERAACLGVAYKASPNTCANAMIAYQVFGGCRHSQWTLPDIFNSDGSYNSSRDCYYLDQYGSCSSYDTGGGGGGGGGGGDYCASQPDPYCCRYPNNYDCSGAGPGPWEPTPTPPPDEPFGPPDPCEGSPDPECCRNPYSYSCGYFDP